MHMDGVEELWVVFHRPETDEALVAEDDGAVAYAYYLLGGQIQGFVWLYNRGAAPEPPPWTLPDANERMPFPNAAGFARPESFEPVSDEAELSVVWTDRDGVPEAAAVRAGSTSRRGGRGDQPGWCALAAKDGPLALSLDPPPASTS